MNMPTPFTLPTADIIGGSRTSLTFNALSGGNRPYDASGCDVFFSLTPYVGFSETPVLQKQMDVNRFENRGVVTQCHLVVHLTTSDTIDLHGKYIYQITVVYPDGNKDVRQGVIFIFRNIAP